MTRSCQYMVMCLAVLWPACAHTRELNTQWRDLSKLTAQASKNGAHKCAPRPLAVALAHLEFAEKELAQGNAHRAEEHLRLATPNAKAAFRLSPAEVCSDGAKPAPGDRDGDGILDPDDACPDDPEDFDGIEDEDGCPERDDTDGDGIADGVDACPIEPEDQDLYLDDDGCPEPDNDLDTLLDRADRCPNRPEDMDGFEDEDGCPDLDNDSDKVPDATDRCPDEPGPQSREGCPKAYKHVRVTRTAIRITQKIHFRYGKARIRPVSYPVLNSVAQVMADYPEITVEVQGHTDDRGSDQFNLNLSYQRAEAVRQYLIKRGVSLQRLTSKGYGETRPIETNATRRGRAINRRVEFVRTDPAAISSATGTAEQTPQNEKSGVSFPTDVPTVPAEPSTGK